MVIDSNSLKSSAGYRRQDTSQPKKGWTCPFCKKTLQLEKAFLAHNCKQKIRANEIKTPLGQAAYSYYVVWNRFQKRATPNIDTFASSKLYCAFKRYAEMVINLKIDKPDAFIRLMIINDQPPVMWVNNQSYCKYLEWCDTIADPIELVSKSMDTLERYAELGNVTTTGIFTHLGFSRTFELIRLRQLSPWFLLNSKQFKAFYSILEDDERRLMDGIINIAYWSAQFGENKELRKSIRDAVEQWEV